MNRLLVRVVTALGLLCLLASVRTSWFELPVDTVSRSGVVFVTTVQPWATAWYQAGSLAVALVISAYWLLRRPGRRLTDISLLSLWLLVLIMFPCLVMVNDPEVAGRAAWMQSQHENLTWLGGDLSTSEEYKNASWKSRLFIVDTPSRVAVLQLPTWQPSQFGMDRLPDLLEWLGYTNTFCQFVQRGWLTAMFGSGCLLMSACFADGRMHIARLRHAVLAVFLATTGILPLAWSFPFRAGQHLNAAHLAAASGNCVSALAHMEQAADIIPVLREDTDYIAQTGLLEHRLQRATPAAILFMANLQEREGSRKQALEKYEQLATGSGVPAGVRREACRGILRSAVNTLNSGSIGPAMDQLRHVLMLEPCNLKANYVLQLACLHCGRRDELTQLVDHIFAVYGRFRFPDKKVVLAASQQNAFFSAVQQGDLPQAWKHSVRMKNP